MFYSPPGSIAPHLFILPFYVTTKFRLQFFPYTILFPMLTHIPCDHLSVFSWLYISIGMLGGLPVSPTNTQTLRHTWKKWELELKHKNRIYFLLLLFFSLTFYHWKHNSNKSDQCLFVLNQVLIASVCFRKRRGLPVNKTFNTCQQLVLWRAHG